MFSSKRFIVISILIVASASLAVTGQVSQSGNSAARSSAGTLLRIVTAEDQRNWNDDLKVLLSDPAPSVRKRAALAAGRIGDERAVPPLAEMLLTDRDSDARQMAAFALGEIESPGGAYALLQILKPANANDSITPVVRARSLEALGKITAAMLANAPPANQPSAAKTEDDRLDRFREAILETLRLEDTHGAQADRLTILLGLTAVLRTKPDGAGPILIKFLDYSDARIVAAALNTMARLRLKAAPERVRQLLNHSDPIVRANAARVIGSAEDKGAFEALLDRALHDSDLRVRVSAIRALGSLKDDRAIDALLTRGRELATAFKTDRASKIVAHPTVQNELLEIVTALGRAMPRLPNLATAPRDKRAVLFFKELQSLVSAPEIETAFARAAPVDYVLEFRAPKWQLKSPWVGGLPQIDSTVFEGLSELASINTAIGGEAPDSRKFAESLLSKWADFISSVEAFQRRDPTVTPRVLRAHAAFKPADATNLLRILRHSLGAPDVIVRATAAELLGGQPASETNTRALIDALKSELARVARGEMNDAALAILDALAKQKSKEANDAIKSALDSDDHLIRRKAVALLKTNGVGDFSDRIGVVKTRNTDTDYARAMARIGKHVTATVETTKGSFVIEFLPEDAPLTADNFIQLARKGFFNGQTIPRVVPNFVIQAGDPRGDTNGGPGYQIRCEINEVPYERGAVGMALSGKDTGGSQWFVTHSPQPHLDGGYTVFGRVVRGMDVVDNIARGDVIRRVIVTER